MKTIFVFTLSTVLLVLLLPAILSFGIRYIPFNNQPPLGATSKIFGDKVFEQPIVVNGDNLVGIGMSFRNPNLRNKKDIKLTLYSPDKKIISQATLNGGIIPDGGFVKFIFAPLTFSEGEEINFALSAPDVSEENSLEVYLSKGGDAIAFVDYYKPPGRLEFIESIYGGWLHRFIADKAFAFFYLGSIVFLILLSRFRQLDY